MRMREIFRLSQYDDTSDTDSPIDFRAHEIDAVMNRPSRFVREIPRDLLPRSGEWRGRLAHPPTREVEDLDARLVRSSALECEACDARGGVRPTGPETQIACACDRNLRHGGHRVRGLIEGHPD